MTFLHIWHYRHICLTSVTQLQIVGCRFWLDVMLAIPKYGIYWIVCPKHIVCYMLATQPIYSTGKTISFYGNSFVLFMFCIINPFDFIFLVWFDIYICLYIFVYMISSVGLVWCKWYSVKISPGKMLFNLITAFSVHWSSRPMIAVPGILLPGKHHFQIIWKKRNKKRIANEKCVHLWRTQANEICIKSCS